jgi:hypothetical protein
MKRTKRVEAEDENGCAPACIAMILGLKYKDVTKHFLRDFGEKGMKHEDAVRFIEQHGYSSITKDLGGVTHKDFLRTEMLKVFAPIHLVLVEPQFDVDYMHSIVMLFNGSILDPSVGHESATTDEYYQIRTVTGFWKD